MRRRPKAWIQVLFLLGAAAAAVIFANFALLGFAVNDEPVGKLTPRAVLVDTTTSTASSTSVAPSATVTTAAEPPTATSKGAESGTSHDDRTRSSDEGSGADRNGSERDADD